MLHGSEPGKNEHQTQGGRDLRHLRIAVERANQRRAEQEQPAERDPDHQIDAKDSRGLPLVQVALLKHRGRQPQIAEGHEDPDERCRHREHSEIGGSEQSRQDGHADELEEEIYAAGAEIEETRALGIVPQPLV